MIDETDRKILRLLQENARMTNKELAAKLDLSITPVYERVKKLERKGYIKGYSARLDHEKIGKGMMVFMHLKLQVHTHENIRHVIEEVDHLEEVMECYHVTGETDYLLKVMVKDMPAYETFVVEKLTKIKGIANINSSIVMSTVKSTTSLDV
ncbi:Lrp/AsnC family transcriptional regulator [Cytophagales bacterium LB-30]|uniref:Lrp/AsnC family transcriptional regulator n=1 Tax=Shiella aurantiaca TaxID=3058365 RepID=A0ABT8F879_9BACT|nr:Lrp/AsnC family transcriptional regulator [Shiella aurantiaca]MDN4166488.1 Lrp/AsnC family transcriptional regulator [Shiella aurantiaca]